MKVLVTGAAGFIGSYLVKRLLERGDNVVGLDNINDYYDVNLKYYRLQQVGIIKDIIEYGKATQSIDYQKYRFYKMNLEDRVQLPQLFQKEQFDVVVNLAAQAGVRYSIENPFVYIESNLVGFANILECCRHSFDNGQKGVQHLVYASSSSVYGGNTKVPFSEDDKVDNPVSLYAATKKSNELLAYAYCKLYNLTATGLRFFTVYGPAGRPDMAYFGFTNKLLNGEKIQIFNYGNCKRDFTYIDDIVEGIVRVIDSSPKLMGQRQQDVHHKVYNIGNNNPENLLDFVDILQQELIRAQVLPCDYDFEPHKELVPMQKGDVPITYADTTALNNDFGFKPNTSLRVGLRRFSEWYNEFYLNK